MKKFLVFLCILILIPVCAFANTPSPVVKKMIHCEPALPFELVDSIESWSDLFEWLYSVKELTKGYNLLDVVYVSLDQEYNLVQWYLTLPISKDQEPFVLIIDNGYFTCQKLEIADEGSVIMNFTNYDIGDYYLCFFIKDAE